MKLGISVNTSKESRKGQVSLVLLENLSWILIIAFYVVFAVLRPTGMLKGSTLVFIVYSALPLGFLVFGEGIILINGRIDLSIAQIAGFTAMLSAMITTKWAPFIGPPFDVLLTLAIGGACGLINGFTVGVLGLNPFLATMGTFIAFDGATLLLQSFPVYEGFSPFFLAIGGVDYISIPIAVAILVILQIILTKTPFGKHVYAVGGSPESARMLGINPNRMYFIVYVLSGVFAGFSAIFYTGFLHAVPPALADGNVFLAFAGAIIGGISLDGGRGSMVNAFAGVIFLGVIEAGLSMFNVSPYLRKVINGLLVILAILINRYRNNMRDKILVPKSSDAGGGDD